jgi:hypothetical protein
MPDSIGLTSNWVIDKQGELGAKGSTIKTITLVIKIE